MEGRVRMTEQCTVTVAADERRRIEGTFEKRKEGGEGDNLPWVAQLLCVFKLCLIKYCRGICIYILSI